MREGHKEAFAESQLPILLDLCERPAEPEELTNCPLCPEPPGVCDLLDHLATHLEDLALLALPNDNSGAISDTRAGTSLGAEKLAKPLKREFDKSTELAMIPPYGGTEVSSKGKGSDVGNKSSAMVASNLPSRHFRTADFESSIDTLLSRFKPGLTKVELEHIEYTSSGDLHKAIAKIQEKQRDTKSYRNLRRIELFIVSMEEYGKVIDVFSNATPILAHVWVGYPSVQNR